MKARAYMSAKEGAQATPLLRSALKVSARAARCPFATAIPSRCPLVFPAAWAQTFDNVLGSQHPRTLKVWDEVARHLAREGEYPDALASAKQLHQIYEARDGPHAAPVADVARLVGSIHLAQGKALQARTSFQQALKVYSIALGACWAKARPGRGGWWGRKDGQQEQQQKSNRGTPTQVSPPPLTHSGKGHKKTLRVAGILETLEPAAEEAAGKWLT